MNDIKRTNGIVYPTFEEAEAALPKSNAGDKLRLQAQKHREDAQDSFDRCDTDGFLSQWASGINSRLNDAKADLLDREGLTVVDVLVDIFTDRVVGVKTVHTKYGEAFPVTRDDKTVWVSAYYAKPETYTKKGVRKAYMHCYADAQTVGGGRGLGGCAGVSVATVPFRSWLAKQLEIK